MASKLALAGIDVQVDLRRLESHDAGRSSDSRPRARSRTRASPRWSWVLTVPIGRPVWRAISSSVASPKNRSATTSRYGSGRAATAVRISVARSARIERRAGSVMRCRGDGGTIRRSVAPALGVPADRAGSRHVDGPSPAGLSEGDPDPDPRQPRAERTVATPARERSVRRHERLLGRVLGLGVVAEDALTGPDERGRLTLDESTERLTVTGEHRLHDGTLVRTAGGRLEARGLAFDRSASPVVRPPASGAPDRPTAMMPWRGPIHPGAGRCVQGAVSAGQSSSSPS